MVSPSRWHGFPFSKDPRLDDGSDDSCRLLSLSTRETPAPGVRGVCKIDNGFVWDTESTLPLVYAAAPGAWVAPTPVVQSFPASVAESSVHSGMLALSTTASRKASRVVGSVVIGLWETRVLRMHP